MPSSTKYQSCADAMTESFQRLNVHDQAKANSSVTFALTPLSCLATTRNSTTPHLNTSLSYSDVTQPRKRRYNTDSPSRPDYSRAQTIQTLQTTITTANFQASRKRRADLISVNNIQADAPSNRSDFDALSTQIANFNMIEPTRPKADFTFTINFSPDSSTVQFKGVCTRPVNTRVAQLKEQECVTTPVVLKIGVRQVAIKSCMKKPKCSRNDVARRRQGLKKVTFAVTPALPSLARNTLSEIEINASAVETDHREGIRSKRVKVD